MRESVRKTYGNRCQNVAVQQGQVKSVYSSGSMQARKEGSKENAKGKKIGSVHFLLHNIKLQKGGSEKQCEPRDVREKTVNMWWKGFDVGGLIGCNELE